MITLHCRQGFVAGPVEVEVDGDLSTLDLDDRVVGKFSDSELMFSVVGKARGSIHLGGYLTPWEYVHWRLDTRNGKSSLRSDDRQQITALARFYGERTKSEGG